MRHSFDIGLRYGDSARAAAALLGSARADSAVMADLSPEVLFADFGADAQLLGVQHWIRLGAPRSGPTVDNDLRHAINAAFAGRSLMIAFPQRDVHLNVADPLDVRVRESA